MGLTLFFAYYLLLIMPYIFWQLVTEVVNSNNCSNTAEVGYSDCNQCNYL